MTHGLKSQDLEYHNIHTDSGLYYALEAQGLMERVITDEQIRYAINNAPQDTPGKSSVFPDANPYPKTDALYR